MEKEEDQHQKQESEPTSNRDPDQIYTKLFDCHCHLHDTSKDLKYLPQVKTRRIVLMGTQESDWDMVEKLYNKEPDRFIPAFGVHPWYAHKASKQYEARLIKLIQKYPQAIIGEVGLDKKATTAETGKCEFDAQEVIFKKMMEIATTYQRPVNVHCVVAFGPMCDYFRAQKNLPPKIMMHSFGGTTGYMNSLLKIPKFGNRFYFSFSHVINMRSPKTREVIGSVPDDRLLIETDYNTTLPVDSMMLEICKVVSQCKSWSMEEAASKTFANAVSVLDPSNWAVEPPKPKSTSSSSASSTTSSVSKEDSPSGKSE